MSSVTNCDAYSLQCYLDGQQEGVGLNKTYDDIYGNMSAYTNTQISIPSAPANPDNYPNLVSTVLHAGLDSMDGTTNCLEAASVYSAYANGGPEANFEIGDFCQASGVENFPYSHDIGDQAFQQNYVRDLGDGIPEVTVELYQPYNGDGYWHAIIYNYAYSRWDQLFSTSSDPVQSGGGYNPDSQNGWSLFETHLYNGPCPTVANSEETSVQVAVETGNDSQNYFRNMQSSDQWLPSNPYGTSCFQNDGSGIGGVYNFQWISPSYAWRVTDPSVTVSPSASANYACSYDDVELRGKCGLPTYSDWTYTTPSNTQVDSTHQIAIQLTGMSNSGSCGDGLSYTVSLINPSGTTVYSSSVTSSNFYKDYNTSAAAGSWKWTVHANNQNAACGSNINTAGTYDDEASGSGSITYSI